MIWNDLRVFALVRRAIRPRVLAEHHSARVKRIAGNTRDPREGDLAGQ